MNTYIDSYYRYADTTLVLPRVTKIVTYLCKQHTCVNESANTIVAMKATRKNNWWQILSIKLQVSGHSGLQKNFDLRDLVSVNGMLVSSSKDCLFLSFLLNLQMP